MTSSQASFLHLSNQNQADGSNSAIHQQGFLSNTSIPNLSNPNGNVNAHHFPSSSCTHNNPSINSQSLAPVSQFPVPFNGSFSQLSNFNGNGSHFPGSHFGNATSHHLPMQNGHLCTPPLVSSSPQDLTKPHGQFYSQNTLQNVNSMVASQQHGLLHNFPQNFNQTMPSLPHGQLFAHSFPQVTNQPRPLQPRASTNMPGGQYGTHNQPINQFINLPHGQFLQRPIGPQVGAFNMPPLMGCLNQGAQAFCYPNPSFPMNAQSSMVNSNQIVQHNTLNQQMFVPCITGQNAMQDLPIAHQNSPMNVLPSLNGGPAQKQEAGSNLEPATFHGPQVNQAKDNKSNFSNFNQRNHQSKYSKNHHGNEQNKPSHARFQKSKLHHVANAKGTFRPPAGKGHYDERVRKSHLENSAKQSRVKDRRSLSLNYSEQEIQQWRDDRKKNYPSKSNIEKRLIQKKTQPEFIDNDAQRRRQQLKEILAKQAELGVEVAELPPNYLLDSNNQVCMKEEENKACSENSRFENKRGRFQNKYGKRRKHGKVNGFVKKQKFGENGSLPQHSLNKRKPTLLQKLLSSDIKRDKTHLLQVFRFMVMNSLFKHWPDKPLEFPLITVKEDAGYGVDSIEKKPYQCQGSGGISAIADNPMLEACEDSKDHDVASDEDENNVVIEEMFYEHVGEIDDNKDEMDDSDGEEGEITD